MAGSGPGWAFSRRTRDLARLERAFCSTRQSNASRASLQGELDLVYLANRASYPALSALGDLQKRGGSEIARIRLTSGPPLRAPISDIRS